MCYDLLLSLFVGNDVGSIQSQPPAQWFGSKSVKKVRSDVLSSTGDNFFIF